MEKRLVLFCIVTAVLLGGQALIQSYLRPPAKPGDKNQNRQVAKSDGSPAEQPEKPDEAVGAQGAKPSDVGPGEPTGGEAEEKAATAKGKPEDSGAEKPGVPEEKTEPAKASVKPQWVTIGSLDPTTGFRLLVTLNNRGAAIERIETASPKYRDLENDSGYLGHLVMTTDPAGQGGLIQAVGAGTPAANAKPLSGSPPGLQVGDVIRAVNGELVASNVIIENLLKSSRPGQTLELTVTRGGDDLKFSVVLERHPLEIVRPEQSRAHDDAPLSCSIELDTVASGTKSLSIPRGADRINKLPSLVDSRWEIVRAEADSVEFRLPLDAKTLTAAGQPGTLECIKRYKVVKAPDGKYADETNRAYHLEMEIEIRTDGVAERQVAYRLDGVNGLPLEGWWYMNKSGARDVVARTDGQGQRWLRAPAIYKQATKSPDEPKTTLFTPGDPLANRAVRYIGVDAQYFAAILLPQGSDGGAGIFRQASAYGIGDLARLSSDRNRTLNVGFELTSEVTKITNDAPLLHKYVLFAGPKNPDLLNQYGATAVDGRGFFTLGELLDYGWFGFVSRPLSRVLHAFYWVMGDYGNYGIAIIMLTVLVRSCMLPISHRATKNAQKMQELSPEIKKIAEKYKDAPEKRVKAQQELFRKHNYNPFGGCLLALCQLPIFIGLYRCLSIDLELRQAALIPGVSWCSNLSGPDMLWDWHRYLPAFLGDETGYLGPYLNVLPLITVGLFLVNQKLITPPATDEQTRMQQQIMKFMTVFMGVLFFKVASGLCIYFIASSCWSLGEHKLLRKGKLATTTATKS